MLYHVADLCGSTGEEEDDVPAATVGELVGRDAGATKLTALKTNRRGDDS